MAVSSPPASTPRILLAGILALGMAVAVSAGSVPSGARADERPSGLLYPAAERSSHVDRYFDVEVADPYRWLESPVDPRTETWVQAQATLAQDYLRSLPTREARAVQIAELLQQPSLDQPVNAGGRLFWAANDGTQAQSVLFVSTSGREDGQVLLDPNALSPDGTVSMSEWVPSPNGRYVAWASSDGGSDWNTWSIRDVETGQDLPERLRWSKFSSVAWTSDSRGLFYARYPKPADPLESVNTGMEIRFHRLGTSVARDPRIYADPLAPGLFVYPVSVPGFDRTWLDLSPTDVGNTLAYLQGKPSNPRVRTLPLPAGASFTLVAQSRQHVIVLTDAAAPHLRIVRIDLRRPTVDHWEEIIPETADTIAAANLVGGRLVVSYLDDASSRLHVFTRAGATLGDIPLPGLGTVGSVSNRGSGLGGFVSFTSYTQPSQILALDVSTQRLREWYSPPVPFEPADFVTEQIWTTSKDGTRVPAFVSRLRSVTPGPTTPTWLYGYGGFNISYSPTYSPDAIAWMQQGGLYVVATLRGGGEYGEEWYRAGTLLRKQNVFDDFVGVAEWLISNGWTSPQHLAANGRSNGGLLAGAMLTQRPDLFGAIIPEVGVLDMLRYQYFTVGYAWAGDYGRSDDSPEMFEYLRGYSPLHNVRSGVDYPATLIMTAERDDRVVPAHSYKFAATLQHANPEGAPMLIRIERRAGHGAGTSIQQRIGMSADRLAFLDAHIGFAPAVSSGELQRAQLTGYALHHG